MVATILGTPTPPAVACSRGGSSNDMPLKSSKAEQLVEIFSASLCQSHFSVTGQHPFTATATAGVLPAVHPELRSRPASRQLLVNLLQPSRLRRNLSAEDRSSERDAGDDSSVPQTGQSHRKTLHSVLTDSQHPDTLFQSPSTSQPVISQPVASQSEEQ